MSINRKFFFDQVRNSLFGGKLSQSQVKGMTVILDAWEAEFWNLDDRILAYDLATAFHETDKTMQPIREYGGKAYFIKRYWQNLKIRKELGNIVEADAYERNGRGFAQETGRKNDERATIELRKQCPKLVAAFEKETGRTFDLIANPEQALHPKIAAAILILGTLQGWFTSRKLTQYFNETTEDWKNARRTVNGIDKANLIADHAKKFYAAISYTV